MGYHLHGHICRLQEFLRPVDASLKDPLCWRYPGLFNEHAVKRADAGGMLPRQGGNTEVMTEVSHNPVLKGLKRTPRDRRHPANKLRLTSRSFKRSDREPRRFGSDRRTEVGTDQMKAKICSGIPVTMIVWAEPSAARPWPTVMLHAVLGTFRVGPHVTTRYGLRPSDSVARVNNSTGIAKSPRTAPGIASTATTCTLFRRFGIFPAVTVVYATGAVSARSP